MGSLDQGSLVFGILLGIFIGISIGHLLAQKNTSTVSTRKLRRYGVLVER